MDIKEQLCIQYYSHRQNAQFFQSFRLIQTIAILLFVIYFKTACSNPDWLENCGACHCNWNSGKKTADCKDKELTSLPSDMSSEMQVIDLSNNKIAVLQRDEFVKANFQNLHKLFMRNCTIQEINRDAFKGLVILIELDLSHNSINVLHPGTFAGTTNLRNVVINYNKIEVLNDYLFHGLNLLRRVELKYNRLKHIGIHAFNQLPFLAAVDLEGNKLKFLRKETFNRFPNLISLSLAQNVWNCSCDLKEFRDFTIANRLYTPPTSCHDPAHLRNKQWNEIPSENFACKPLIISSSPFLEVYSENITLPCRIESFPYPNVTWMFEKRPISENDAHFKILNSIENLERKVFTSELQIYGIKSSDKGIYTCVAENRGGRAETEFQLSINGNSFNLIDGINNSGVIGVSETDTQLNILFVVCLILTIFLILLIIAVLLICRYCGKMRINQKDAIMNNENKLISTKVDRMHNTSINEGSVKMEMQKSLLTDVNPVEKPPRRSESETNEECESRLETKKNLLSDTQFGNHQYSRNDETSTIDFSDIVASNNGCSDFIEENYGRSLPPDLLAFPPRVSGTSPSMQSSQSNIPEPVIYSFHSPTLSNAVYSHLTPHGVFSTTAIPTGAHNGFMTLQHPKSRNLAVVTAANNCQQQQQKQSPFVPAPVLYSPVNTASIIMKQGYMTIPRKPRIPSWAASGHATHLNDFQSPVSSNLNEIETPIIHEISSEPVYDNLGLRTTAGGNSTLNLTKLQNIEPTMRYTMHDRPLPATPSLTSVASNSKAGVPKHHQLQKKNHNNFEELCPMLADSTLNTSHATSKIYEPIHELVDHRESKISLIEPLYDTTQSHRNLIMIPAAYGANKIDSGNPKVAKIPPRPPPKPTKKKSMTTCGGKTSTSKLFDDECQDGTEV